MDKDPVTLTLCDFSRHLQPFRQSFRSLDTYLLRLQTEGEARALIGGAMAAILPGDLLLYRPGDAYDLQIEAPAADSRYGPSADYYVMATGPWLDEWWRMRERPSRIRIADDGKIDSVWQQLMLERRRLDGGSRAILAALLQALCLLLDRAITEAPAAAKSGATALQALKIKHFVEANATASFTLDEAAAHAGISKTRAVHLFKQQIGCSIMQYAQQVRLAMALRLMDNSQLTLEQIADESGFGTYTYFHRVFRERYGLSPGSYRKRE
ncbi:MULTISPECIES: AraC family transcriptional regulator [unclassified Paenibacillus]|uniref:helix-turn-helix transcriptional regulator n=1 Tax=unclassified Paenibacillus TaxID=185978 RepID=UPI000953AC5C|nr:MULTISPECIES: AraC family transcriptional regulator [unclassified Paenibacillus]ASS67322.1 helix-turn-helix transcriptional regulator [Paenibacillus sp. RUD330]SIQ81376.1 AraC family transcriptional regulator, arabinose operon regulatory protein [Paenibacillus sp. RU4X]SIR02829.1 AraC family transcriptional regulator, arabinose operon regulatory protein [Paenibacillus sp. RU4T]